MRLPQCQAPKEVDASESQRPGDIVTRIFIPGGALLKCDWPDCEVQNPKGGSWRVGRVERKVQRTARNNWFTLQGPMDDKHYCEDHGILLVATIEASKAAAADIIDASKPCPKDSRCVKGIHEGDCWW